MVNALLIYPEFPDTFWSFKHALSLLGKKSAFPPLGLMTVAAMLPETWNRRLVDMNVGPLRDSDIEWADIILASAVQIQRQSLRRLIKRCKSHNKTVVIGGPYTSTCPEDTHGADHVFRRSGRNLPDVSARLEQWRSKAGLPQHATAGAE